MYSNANSADVSAIHNPWNKGRLIGPKPPLKLREIWAIRIRLQLAQRARDLALFNLSIDSKLRGCDLVKLQVRDVAHSGRVIPRATVMQQKTGQPVKFELTDQTREAVEAWIAKAQLSFRSIPVPEPHDSVTAYFDTAVCADREIVGSSHRIGPRRLRHPLAASYQGDADLQANQESPSGSAAAWSHQAGEHGQISRH